MSTGVIPALSRSELRGPGTKSRIQGMRPMATVQSHVWNAETRHEPHPLPVGLFVDSFTPIMDGVTVTVQNYASWLHRLLGPTFVVTPSVPGHADHERYDVIRFLSLPTVIRKPYRVGLPALDGRLKSILRSRDFSIVHAHSPFGAGRAALAAGRERGVPLVATFHSKFRENLLQSIPIRRMVDAQVRRIVDFLYSVDQVWIPQESVAATLRSIAREAGGTLRSRREHVSGFSWARWSMRRTSSCSWLRFRT
jgi:glycosyltransferase involved in cell wall biosynthesis